MAGSANNTHTQELEKELDRLRKQYFWLRISRAKLIMDLIFVSELYRPFFFFCNPLWVFPSSISCDVDVIYIGYECFKLQRGRRAVMPLSGLMSAILRLVLACHVKFEIH